MHRLAVLLCVLTPAVALAQPPKPPVAPPPKPFDINDWTPRPAVGQAEPWEKKKDPEWDDARLRQMNTGPTFNGTIGRQADVIVNGRPAKRTDIAAYKGTAVKLGDTGDACVVFDRATMRLAAGWTGGYLLHSDRRFGLLNTPLPPPAAQLVFATSAVPGWADAKGQFPAAPKPTAPLPPEHVKYRGHYLHGDRVVFSYTVNGVEVLESVTLDQAHVPVLCRQFEIAPHKQALTFTVASSPTAFAAGGLKQGSINGAWVTTQSRLDVATIAGKGVFRGVAANLGVGQYEHRVEVLPSEKTEVLETIIALTPRDQANKDALEKFADARPLPKPLAPLTKPGPLRWGKPLETKLVKGDESGPFAVDTLTIPYDNPFKALFFCTGLDFLPDGRVAMCTCHGDVWLTKVTGDTVSWQRFATGLYHPLGLKVVDGKVVVLERGQLTRLHDSNDDGEADFYECVCNDWHTGSGEHSYDTCLETDPQGNFYFFKTGDTDLPSGGTLLKVSKDGSKVETFATGFRHPIGMGMSSTGVVTGADQEGNWMPATRIDQYKAGGFYGDMRAHHRTTPPKTFDPPICWLPREVDNSAGGQVWVPLEPGAQATGWSKSPLAGLPLHLSYGRCRPYVLLRQEFTDGTVQGGVAPLPISFLSGSCRGRFDPTGDLWVCGLNGWQTAAKADGSLQRVRYTGKPLDTVVKMEAVQSGVKLTFTRPLDPKTATDPANYKAAWWGYRWSGDYGSKRWKVSNPNQEGQDEFPFTAAKLLDDNKTVLLTVPGGMKAVMQMQVGYNVTAKEDAAKVTGSVFLTVHKVARE